MRLVPWRRDRPDQFTQADSTETVEVENLDQGLDMGAMEPKDEQLTPDQIKAGQARIRNMSAAVAQVIKISPDRNRHQEDVDMSGLSPELGHVPFLFLGDLHHPYTNQQRQDNSVRFTGPGILLPDGAIEGASTPEAGRPQTEIRFENQSWWQGTVDEKVLDRQYFSLTATPISHGLIGANTIQIDNPALLSAMQLGKKDVEDDPGVNAAFNEAFGYHEVGEVNRQLIATVETAVLHASGVIVDRAGVEPDFVRHSTGELWLPAGQ